MGYQSGLNKEKDKDTLGDDEINKILSVWILENRGNCWEDKKPELASLSRDVGLEIKSVGSPDIQM